MPAGELTIDLNGLLPLATAAHGVGQQMPGAGGALSDGWAPPRGFACASAVTTCQGAWNGTFQEMGSTFTSVGDKLLATVGVIGTTDDDSADQFDATRAETGGDTGKYERYR